MNNGKQPAFGYGFTTADGSSHINEQGLTKREYFAGLAMQGLLVNYAEHGHYGNNSSFPCVSEIAVQVADELLKQLEL